MLETPLPATFWALRSIVGLEWLMVVVCTTPSIQLFDESGPLLLLWLLVCCRDAIGLQ